MIKVIVSILLYIALIPVFYFIFLWLVWLFNYKHDKYSFYDYFYNEEYDNWSDEGRYCRMLSAIFPLGIFIIFLYFFLTNSWHFIYNRIVKLLKK